MFAPPTGLIFDIKKFSIHDGPGIRTTVFLKGCPLHCAWCHNPEGISPTVEIHYWENRCISCHECVEVCESGALGFIDGKRTHDSNLCQGCGACAQACPAEATDLVGTWFSVSQLMGEIQKDLIYYDQSGGGVTFSGGEPLLQVDFQVEILKNCQDQGIHTAVDTSGHVPANWIKRIIPFTDLFLYDVKMIDSQKHFQYTGVPNHRILDNLRMLSQEKARIILRLPIIPGVNDDDENLQNTGSLIQEFDTIEQVNILPYHQTAIDKYRRMGNHYSMEPTRPHTEEQLFEIAWQLERYGCPVIIGG